MHLSLCISPNLFHRDIYRDEIFHELKKILNNTKNRTFLIFDHDEYLKDKYKEYIRATNDDDFIKQIEILLTSIEADFSDKIIKIGNELQHLYVSRTNDKKKVNFDFSKFYNKIICNLKIIKNVNKNNNFFYIICSHQSTQDKKIDTLNKFIIGSDFDKHSIRKKLDEFSDSIKISNQNIKKITKDYIVPTLWNSEEINFYDKNIANAYNNVSKNHEDFYVHLKNLLVDIIDHNEKIRNLKINIITGGNKDEKLKDEEALIEKNIINKLKNFPKFKGLMFNLIYHYQPIKYRNVHPRAIMSENIVIAFEVIPQVDRNDRRLYEKRFNDIALKKSYISTAKDLLIKNNNIAY